MNMSCDGCGQISSPAHIAQRLQRLEWTTRYRPVHIQTLLLSAESPTLEQNFLYSPSCEFQGEAAKLLEVAGISAAGKTREAVLAEFQRAGFFLTYILECAFERESQGGSNGPEKGDSKDSELRERRLLEQRLPAIAARIRRSLKPKRVVLFSRMLEPLVEKIGAMQLGSPVVLHEGKPFILDGLNAGESVARLREALVIRTDWPEEQ